MARRSRNDRHHFDRQMAWETFKTRLEAACTYEDGQRLLADAVAVNRPGREFYSNLGHFLGQFDPPAGATRAEAVLYVGYLRRLDAVGALKKGALPGLLDGLRAAFGPME